MHASHSNPAASRLEVSCGTLELSVPDRRSLAIRTDARGRAEQDQFRSERSSHSAQIAWDRQSRDHPSERQTPAISRFHVAPCWPPECRAYQPCRGNTAQPEVQLRAHAQWQMSEYLNRREVAAVLESRRKVLHRRQSMPQAS